MTAAANTRSVLRRPRLPRRWRAWVSVLIVLASPALYSYVATMEQPSSLPLAVRSVEWVRSHHGSWLVDETEHVYYGWLKAPRTGGPALPKLPPVALPPATPTPTAMASPTTAAGTGPGLAVTAPATPTGQSSPVSRVAGRSAAGDFTCSAE
jgi:predicted DNA-binding transcriptional regulator AlpA